MATIVTRSGKGSPLTNNEVDANFTNLNTELGTKVNASSLAAVATSGAYADLSGRPTNVSSFTNDSGYLTSFTEADPTVPSHVKAITTTNISNWNTAFGWGNHASAGYLTGITSGQITTALGFTPATAAQGAKADTAVQTITSTDGSISITGTTAIDLSVAVAGSTSNVLLPVRNTTGATLTKGTAVYISGATGQISTVSKAIATSDATSAQTLGLVTADISNNSNGNVTLIGAITNINTSAYTDGQQLYLSPTTAGTLTATKPHAPDHLVYMAVVEHAHPTQGKLFVKVQNGYEMDELHDVSAQSPANNDGLFYNTSTSLWEKKSIVTALGYTPYNATNPSGYLSTVSLTSNVTGTLPVANGGTGATSLTSGYLVKGNGASAASASIVYDNGTNVGVGTSAPLSKLHVNGAAAGGGIIAFVTNTDATGFTSTSFGDGTNTKGQIWVGNASYASFGGAGSMNYSANSGPHVWYTNYSERMRLDASGNLGIGTSSPSSKLDVSSLVTLSGPENNQLRWLNSGKDWRANVSAAGNWYLYDVTNTKFPFTIEGNAPSDTFRLASNGNVGIGTASPSSRLDVKRGSNATEVYPSGNWAGRIVNATDSASENGLIVGNRWASTNSWVVDFGSIFGNGSGSWSSYYKIDGVGQSIWGSGSAGTERMRLGANGGLAIGGTGTDATLHIQSAVGGYNRLTQMAPSGTSKDAFNIMAAKNSGGSDLWWSWGVDTSNRWRINQGVGFANNGVIMDDVGQITSADVAAAFGYKGLPQNQRTSAYTLALSDIGKHLYVTAGAFAVTIPADGTLNFPIGATMSFVCEDAAKTIVPASGVTLVLAGTGAATTGTRTLAIGAVATLIKVQANRWYISGSGVT